MKSRFFPSNEPALPRRRRKSRKEIILDYLSHMLQRPLRTLQAMFYGAFLS